MGRAQQHSPVGAGRCHDRPAILHQATGRLDGKIAAASTARRHRTILANAMVYAVEMNLLDSNPIRALKWTAPRVSGQVDRRCVVNPGQARALLDAVRAQQPSGPRLVAFFGLMYYAGFRPEEAVSLSTDCVSLPPPAQEDGWGELHLRTRRLTPAVSGPTTESAGEAAAQAPR